jgi:acyl-coenzyme A synthetase/AMP-(fatty) acid ligase
MIGFETHFLPISHLSKLSSLCPTFVTAIPDILRAVSRQDLHDLRFIRSASAPLSPQLYEILQQKFQVPVLESFGMTETCSHCFTNPLHGEQRPGTVGLPSGVEAKIEHEHLYLRGFSTAYADWFDTGDLAEQDSVGYYRILGRATDRINVRGYKLDPLSLENQIRPLFPELNELAVFGTDTVKCVYSGPYTTAEISQALSALGTHCRPGLIKQVVEIPKNASGKISRSLLDHTYQ